MEFKLTDDSVPSVPENLRFSGAEVRVPEIIKEITEKLKGNENASGQRTAVRHILPIINKFNQTQPFSFCQMTITNVASEKNKFEAWIIGFNGKYSCVSAMLETGNVINGVIGTSIASKAAINSDKYGCSYVFAIRKDNKIFVDVAISDTKPGTKYSNCYTEDRVVDGVHTGYAGTFEKEGIDLLVSYRSLKKMRKFGFYPVALPNKIPLSPKYIGFGYKSGLEVTLNGVNARTEINTGAFGPTDLYITRKWYLLNKDKFPNFKMKSYFPLFGEGIIETMVFYYNNSVYEFKDLSCVCVHTSLWDGNTEIQCTPTKQFMAKLMTMGIIPTYF